MKAGLGMKLKEALAEARKAKAPTREEVSLEPAAHALDLEWAYLRGHIFRPGQVAAWRCTTHGQVLQPAGEGVLGCPGCQLKVRA